MKELFVDPATGEALPRVLEFIEREFGAYDIPAKIMLQIVVAAEEVFINIANHAYAPLKGDALIRCAVDNDPPQVILQFQDKGAPFNPLERPLPDTSLPPEEREIGGLGVLIVRKTMSDVAYEYKDGMNILTIKKDL